MDGNICSQKVESAYISRNFAVEVILPNKGCPTFVVREIAPNGMAVITTLGTYKELCQFFDTLKR